MSFSTRMFKIYRAEVDNHTLFQDLHELPDYDRPRANDLRSVEGVVLDHKYSVIEGFSNGIPVQAIAHIDNLRYVSAYENTVKNRTCVVDDKNYWLPGLSRVGDVMYYQDRVRYYRESLTDLSLDFSLWLRKHGVHMTVRELSDSRVLVLGTFIVYDIYLADLELSLKIKFKKIPEDFRIIRIEE